MLHSIGVGLDQIDKIETSVSSPGHLLTQPGFLKSSPKITLHFKIQDTSLAETAKPVSPPQSNWICTYCTFSNPYPSNYSSTSSIPPCLNCGMPPPPGTLTIPPPSAPTLSIPRPVPTVSTEALFPCPRCTFLNHPALTACEICGEPLISPNLPPILASAEAIDRGVSPAPQASEEKRNYVRLSFRAGGEKPFLERLKNAISNKTWESKVDNLLRVTAGKTIGINGLERASAAIRLQNDVVLQSSLKDLEALMSRAKDLIVLAEQLAVKVPSNEATNALRESSEVLGLSSPIVTKELAGGQESYYIELARQVAEFLTTSKDEKGSYLRREGGIIPLIDVFALYNKARGVGIFLFDVLM
jgi:ESCRT-II complex subunit VPS36